MDAINYSLNEESPRVKQPENINLQLKPHQLASLYRMCMLDRDCGMSMKSADIRIHSNVAILADLSGHGKTLSFLAMVQELKSVDTQWMPQAIMYLRGSYGITWTKRNTREYINTSLIVIPNNLIDHWQQHIEKYTELTYETIDSGYNNVILIEEYDIILCPAKHYNIFVQHNREYFWNRVAFDEADSIHIPNTERVDARFLWFITATFDNIPRRSNNGFIKDLFKSKSFNSIDKYFHPVVVKGTDEFVKKSFSLIEPRVHYIDCLAPKYIQAVRHHITPRVLELVSAGDLDGAIIALGGNVDNDRNIFDLITRNIKNNITSVQARKDALEKLEITPEDREKKQEKLTKRLQSLRTRMESLEQSISDVANSDCTICCDTLQHPTLTPCCNNIFCAQCLLKWLKENNICPMCRARFDPSNLYTIGAKPVTKKSRITKKPEKDKLQTIIDVIKKNPEGKYLVFSGHKATFREVGDILDSEKMRYGTLTSSLRTEKTLQKFKNGDLSVILLDAEHNGAGLEIQTATDVILFHQMRKSLETQAIARAQRPGRIGQLRVWKLQYQHEYRGPGGETQLTRPFG